MRFNITKLIKHPAFPAVVAGATGLAAGYWFGRREAMRKIQEEIVNLDVETKFYEQLTLNLVEATDEIERVRLVRHPSNDNFDPNVIPDDFPQPPTNEPIYATMTLVRDELDDIVDDYEPTPDPPPVNIFLKRGDPGEGWDWSSELESRTPDNPYIIHIEEFVGEESGFNQDTVTYYAADDVVVDEQDQIMEDYRRVLGELKFGHGSQDANIVYIRNDKWGCEWEVLYDASSYLESVVSSQAIEDIKHHRVPKFKKEE